MTSPFQRGKKRGVGYDGPTLARPQRRRGSLRRTLGVLAGLMAGVAGWLTLGTAEVGDSARLGAVGVLPSDPGPDRTNGRDLRKPPDRRDQHEAAEARVLLGVEDPLPVDFENPPAAGLVFDLETGETLWRRSPTAERPVASLTKIMSALLIADEIGRPGQRVTVDPSGAGLEASGGLAGSSVGLEPGMRVSARSLFHTMLIASANDAATALAVHTSGSAGRFVKQMNERARELGLDCTHFVSPHGLEPENRSCAADIAVLTRLAMGQRLIARVARKDGAVVDFPIEGGERHLATTNPLLQSNYEGTVGLKTGYTQLAGSSLAAVVRRDGRTLAAVLLDSPDVGSQARQLLDAAFGGSADGDASGKR